MICLSGEKIKWIASVILKYDGTKETDWLADLTRTEKNMFLFPFALNEFVFGHFLSTLFQRNEKNINYQVDTTIQIVIDKKKRAKWNHQAQVSGTDAEQNKLDIGRHRDDDVQNDIWTTLELSETHPKTWLHHFKEKRNEQ